MAKGATWMVALRFFKRGIGIFSTIILARLLVPEDFGIVAMATALMSLIVMFSELGVETVLVRKDVIDENDLDSAWSLQVVIGFFQAFGLVMLAWPAAQFFSEPRLEPVIYVLSAGVLIHGFRNIGTVAFRREMTFNKDFVLEGSKKVASFLVTVAIAVVFRTYWALVAGIVAARVTHVVLSYIMHPYRPGWSRARWGEIFGFSKWLLVNSGLQFLTQKSPIFVLGRVAGAQGAGLFNVAYDIAMFATQELVAPINRALLPGYARLQHNPEQLKKSYLDALGIVVLFLVPAGLGLAATADPVIPVVLGAQWSGAIPIAQHLACAGAVMGMLANTAPVLLAMGRPRLITALGALRNSIFLPSLIVFSVYFGVEGASLSLLFTMLAMVPVNFAIISKKLNLRLVDLGSCIVRPLLGAGAMAMILKIGVVPLLTRTMTDQLWGAALLSVASGAVIYFTIVYGLWSIFGGPGAPEPRILNLLTEQRPVLRRTWNRVAAPHKE